MIQVVAVITTLPGKRDQVLAAFKENRPAVLAEHGCIEYGAVVDTPDVGRFQAPIGADTFMVIEKWADLDALKAHGMAPHMAAYAARTKAWIAQRAIHVLSPVE